MPPRIIELQEIADRYAGAVYTMPQDESGGGGATLRHRAGLHLGNWGSIPSNTRDIIRRVRPGLLLAMENIPPNDVVDWARATPDGMLVLRKHYAAPEGGANGGSTANWANGQCNMIENYLHHPAIRVIYEAGRLIVKQFNEVNFGFEWGGSMERIEAIQRYNGLFPSTAAFIKQRFPKAQIAGPSLAPGNWDVQLPNDPDGVYWLQEDSHIRDALAAMDYFSCHVYPLPGTWATPWLGQRFIHYWQFLPERLRQRTLILECSAADAAGQHVRAEETSLWLNSLSAYPNERHDGQIVGTALWWMRDGDRTWEGHFYTDPNGTPRPIVEAVADYNEGAVIPDPDPEPQPDNWRDTALAWGRDNQIMHNNPDSSLERVARGHGFYPVSNEGRTDHPTLGRVAIRAFEHGDGRHRVYYAPTSNYADVRYEER
ncbi:MAG: hypothetical protein KDD73_13670 [Anaerolineales bacterium]|nr:hypothetical protein [Anaerolineales bacterium]